MQVSAVPPGISDPGLRSGAGTASRAPAAFNRVQKGKSAITPCQDPRKQPHVRKGRKTQLVNISSSSRKMNVTIFKTELPTHTQTLNPSLVRCTHDRHAQSVRLSRHTFPAPPVIHGPVARSDTIALGPTAPQATSHRAPSVRVPACPSARAGVSTTGERSRIGVGDGSLAAREREGPRSRRSLRWRDLRRDEPAM